MGATPPASAREISKAFLFLQEVAWQELRSCNPRHHLTTYHTRIDGCDIADKAKKTTNHDLSFRRSALCLQTSSTENSETKYIARQVFTCIAPTLNSEMRFVEVCSRRRPIWCGKDTSNCMIFVQVTRRKPYDE